MLRIELISRRHIAFGLLVLGAFTMLGVTNAVAQDPAASTLSAGKAEQPYVEAELTSSFDGTKQPFRYAFPESSGDAAKPVLVFLHSWSSNYHLHEEAWLNAALQRGWIFVEPNFRGPNKQPLACGSAAARADILDCVEFAIEKLNADPNRVYLAGASGGGHMTLLMAGRHPERFTAASAWVGISDLTKWYEFHTKNGKPQRYAQMIAQSCGGGPGSSEDVDREYYERSPINWITNVGDLPIDIAAGVHDGQTGSVPFQHSVRAYNKIAASRGADVVREDEMQQLWDKGELADPQPVDTKDDPTYGRAIKLRRRAGTARLTIFEGGHEGLAEAACAWLENYRRPTESVSVEASSTSEK